MLNKAELPATIAMILSSTHIVLLVVARGKIGICNDEKLRIAELCSAPQLRLLSQPREEKFKKENT